MVGLYMDGIYAPGKQKTSLQLYDEVSDRLSTVCSLLFSVADFPSPLSAHHNLVDSMPRTSVHLQRLRNPLPNDNAPFRP